MAVDVDRSLEQLQRLRANIARVFVGHPSTIDQLIRCLLARGHVLIEDVPGVGKTVLATALAKSIEAKFSRIQLTPDLLPADVIGVSIFDRGAGTFQFRKGPIFANIVLADEINRTTPRTQSALLEAMSERTVTVEGRTFVLDAPFMVVATQNPFDFEGTYPLPENQLDRFLMRLSLGYPSPDDEAAILDLRPSDQTLHELQPVMHGDEVVSLQAAVDAVRLDRSLIDYIVALARATREHEDVRLGVSTRGCLALAHAARATALSGGRDYCIPEDITGNIEAVAAHRILTRTVHDRGGLGATRDVLTDVVHSVPSPI
jgi:MoxR-like ATPase